MSVAVRAVQTSIGLTAELKVARRQRKAIEASAKGISAPQADHSQIEEKHDDADDFEDDEHFGGGNNFAEKPGDAPPPYKAREAITSSDEESPEPSLNFEPRMLPCPVIIPQRRPGTKIRGFMRAYAPILANHDISQQTFVTFLKSFHQESQASPVLSVITVGAGMMGNLAEPATVLTALTIQLISGTAWELQGRYRTNRYLDQANEKLFKPRGLYCLIMSFRPDEAPEGGVGTESVDISKAALKWLSPPTSGLKTKASNFRKSSGITHGELELPETAPLIYLDTGYAETRKTKETGRFAHQKTVIQHNRKVAQDYFDKRARAKYAYKYPNSSLAIEAIPHFASKYGNPAHPSVTASSFDHISSKIKHENLADMQARKREKELQSRKSGGTVKRLLQKSVLYLMIVNLPTEAEMAEAKVGASSSGSGSLRLSSSSSF